MGLPKNFSGKTTVGTLNVVVDTNILYSGILFEGLESILLDLAQTRRINLFTCEYVVRELSGVFKKRGLSTELLREYFTYSNIRVIADRDIEGDIKFLEHLETAKKTVSDVKDRPIFVFARIMLSKDHNTYLVSGDRDLLNQKVREELEGKVKTTREMIKLV